MKKRVPILILCLLISLGLIGSSVYATDINESVELSTDPTASQTITLANAPTDRPLLEKLKRSVEQNGITLEQALDDYVTEQVDQGLGGAHEGNPGNLSSNEDPEDLPSLPPDITIDGITLDELEDLKLIAESEGISFTEAIDRYAWQTQFVQVADELEETYPETFAGAVFGNDGSSAWFAFKDDIPERAVEATAALPATIELFGGRGFSEHELKTELEAVHDRIYLREDIANVHSHYDIETGIITVEAQPTERITQLEHENLLSQLQKFKPHNDAITIEITLVDQLEGGGESKYIRGGGRLDSNSKDDGHCTAGFTLRDSSGLRAIATAHHCGGKTRTYRNHSGDGGSTTVTHIGAHGGRYGDLARYSIGSKTAARTFYYNWDKKRYATAVWSPRKGVRVCNFGRTRGAKCDEVYRLHTTRGIYKGMVATRNHVTSGGDSGGPWYYGGTAFGIHSGYATIALFKRSQFTPAQNLPKVLGMRVHTK